MHNEFVPHAIRECAARRVETARALAAFSPSAPVASKIRVVRRL
jgi:hypothetical protein